MHLYIYYNFDKLPQYRENLLAGGIHRVNPLVAYQDSTSGQLFLTLFKNHIDK